MRRILILLKELAITALVFLCAATAFALTRLPVFEKGEAYELYYTSCSSAQSCLTNKPLLVKLIQNTQGESVRFYGDCYKEIKNRYNAELVFCEEACGVKNYYLYSSALGKPVDLGGRLVNLHVAVSGEQTAVGTPLIFGGY